MLKNGTYTAWFKTSKSGGAALVHLSDGAISGGDSILTYTGSYQLSGNQFKAIISTARHCAGHDTIFGIDNLTLRIEGSGTGKYVTFHGEADEVPGMRLEGTLIPSEEKQPSMQVRVTTPKFNIDRLPKPSPRSR